jgi:DNA-binding NtrC family response regulator
LIKINNDGTSLAQNLYMKTLEEIRQEHILQVLEHTNWDTKKASEVLHVSESFLKKEIQKLGYSNNTKRKKKLF